MSSSATSWTAARQTSLSFTISQSLLKLMSIESVMPCNHLILCHPLLLLPSVFPSIRVFSSELALHMAKGRPKLWSFSFSISPSNEHLGLISFKIVLFCCCSVGNHVQLCDLMDCSTADFLVLHHLPEFAQTYVHQSVMPSNHLILCWALLLLPSIFPSIRVFSNESVLCIRWPKYWSFSLSISPSNEYSGLLSFRMNCLDLLAVQGTLRVFSNTTVQKHQFFSL